MNELKTLGDLTNYHRDEFLKLALIGFSSGILSDTYVNEKIGLIVSKDGINLSPEEKIKLEKVKKFIEEEL